MTETQRLRAIAGLSGHQGFKDLLNEVFKTEFNHIMANLRRTRNMDEVTMSAVEIRLLEKLKEAFETAPEKAAETLKDQGDVLYV